MLQKLETLLYSPKLGIYFVYSKISAARVSYLRFLLNMTEKQVIKNTFGQYDSCVLQVSLISEIQFPLFTVLCKIIFQM